jgi:hypothetical protein
MKVGGASEGDGRSALDLLEIWGVDRGRSLDSAWATRLNAAGRTEAIS